MIFDCFTYYNEVDILRIRLEELDPIVDKFIIVEATETFTGHPKPLYFNSLPAWIKKWEDRIIRVIVEFPSGTMTPWEREAFQRNEIMRGLKLAPLESYVLISDVDEIPRLSSIIQVDKPVHLDVTQYFWKFNWQVPHHCNQGARPVWTPLRAMTSPHHLRIQSLPRIKRAGWHFSFFGDYDSIESKIGAFSHTEMNTPEYKSAQHINRCIQEGIDPFDRFPLKYVEVDQTFPQWVQSNINQLTHLYNPRSNNAGAKF